MIICSVGGGGLLNGIRIGLREVYGEEKGNSIPVLGVETDGSHSLTGALKNHEKGWKLPNATSIATSLGCLIAADQTYIEATTTNFHSVLVNDQQAVNAL